LTGKEYPVRVEKCEEHQNIVIELNTHKQEIKTMREHIDEVKKDNKEQNEKLDSIYKTIRENTKNTESLFWKGFGAIGTFIVIAQIILQVVK